MLHVSHANLLIIVLLIKIFNMAVCKQSDVWNLEL